jgi:hypothetical protein
VTALTEEWVKLDEAHVNLADLAFAELAEDELLREIQSLHALAVDAAMSLDDLDALFA